MAILYRAPNGESMKSRLKYINALKNIGQFENVNGKKDIELDRVVLIYAENGRGKTTLSSILRSLTSQDPLPVVERRRLGTRKAPYVELELADGTKPVFKKGRWQQSGPNILIFDDHYIDSNIHSGLVVEAEHRRHLHEVIVGSKGVSLQAEHQRLIDKTTEHNRKLLEIKNAIGHRDLAGMTLEDFCKLAREPKLNDKIEIAEREATAKSKEEGLLKQPNFEELRLPEFELSEIESTLETDISGIDAKSEQTVLSHLKYIGSNRETWIHEGLEISHKTRDELCPFCGQSVSSVDLLRHYRRYFSAEYDALKQSIEDHLQCIQKGHASVARESFSLDVANVRSRYEFWTDYCNVDSVELDESEILEDWAAAQAGLQTALEAKSKSPLDSMAISESTRDLVAKYDCHRQSIDSINMTIAESKDTVEEFLAVIASKTSDEIDQELARLKAIRERFSKELSALCDSYLKEQRLKERTEKDRDAAKVAIETYMNDVFPNSETRINRYLGQFGAGFRLKGLSSSVRKGGTTCNYSLLVNSSEVPVAGGTVAEEDASFKNTMSAGDRNTLAYAVFLAAVDDEPDLDEAIVVFDDPISSLDDQRSYTTVETIVGLIPRVAQTIVLSHNRRFLCRVWEHFKSQGCTSLEIVRLGAGSTIQHWNVSEDSKTEHDRRHSMFVRYLEGSSQSNDLRMIAQAIRPHLEAYFRIARPGAFPPKTLMDKFIQDCRKKTGTSEEVLDQQHIDELAAIVKFANRFHHDTNPAWETESITDGELSGFVRRMQKLVAS